MNESRRRERRLVQSPEQIANIAKALSHPARVEIVALLHDRRTCIGCDIVDEVGLAQSTTSEHLRVLKTAGLIVGAIERPRVCYSLNPDALEPLATFLGLMRATRTTVIPATSLRRVPAAKKSSPSKPHA